MKTNMTTNGQIIRRGGAAYAIALTFSLILTLPAYAASADDLGPLVVTSPGADGHIAIDRAPLPKFPRETASGGGALSSGAPCPGEWSTPFNDPGLDGETIYALTVYEGDLYAGGTFTSVGGESVNHIARWNGESWSALGGGVNGIVRTMLVHDGSLYVGGFFTTADGQTVNHISRWDGESWHAAGDGFNNAVMAMTEHKGDLVAGGMFTHAGQNEVNRVARWDASASEWQPLGEGMNRSVLALASTDLGLVAGGHFTAADGASAGRVALWSADQWMRLGGGFIGPVHTLLTQDGLPLAGGAIQTKLAFFGDPKWDDDPENPNLGQPADRALEWSTFDWVTLTDTLPPTPNHSINALVRFNDMVHAAGKFTDVASGESSPPVPAKLVARWDGESWRPLDKGLGGMYNAIAEAMATYDGKLIVAGYFATAGGEPATSIAAWDPPLWAGQGDINCDGVIDGTDLLLLLASWGECDDPDNCPADLNGDGVVDGGDLLILLSNWG